MVQRARDAHSLTDRPNRTLVQLLANTPMMWTFCGTPPVTKRARNVSANPSSVSMSLTICSVEWAQTDEGPNSISEVNPGPVRIDGGDELVDFEYSDDVHGVTSSASGPQC